MMLVRMRVKDAQRMPSRCHVAPQRQVDRVGIALLGHHGRDRVMASAVSVMRDDTALHVIMVAPHVEHAGRRAEHGIARGARELEHAQRPHQRLCAHIAKTRDLENALNLGAHHGKHMAAALEVVMGENGAAHNRQVRVGTHKVVRQGVDKVEQARHVLAINMHGPMLRAHGDAVLFKVRIRAILQAPALSPQLDGNNSQVLAGRVRAQRARGGATRIPFVAHAQLAGGIRLNIRGTRKGCGDIARILFRLGEVDGDFKVAPPCGRGPGDIARDSAAADVTRIAAQTVEPVGRGGGAGLRAARKLCGDLRGTRHQAAHNRHSRAVAAAG